MVLNECVDLHVIALEPDSNYLCVGIGWFDNIFVGSIALDT